MLQPAIISVAMVQLDSAQLGFGGFGGFGWHALSESSQAINSPAGLRWLRLTCNLVMACYPYLEDAIIPRFTSYFELISFE